MVELRNEKGSFTPQWRKSIEAQRQDAEIKKILDNRIKASVNERKPRADLVDNFHWIIMRARRQKKITQEQLADEIGETIASVKKAELGIIPEGEYELVIKLENFLNLSLIKDKSAISQKTETEKKNELDFSVRAPPELTIADLKRMQKEKIVQDLWDYSEYLREKEREGKEGKKAESN